MNRLFKSKRRAFWGLQILGWLGYGTIRALNGLAHGQTVQYIYPSIVAMMTGFLLSLILRAVFHTIRDKPLPYVAVVAALLSGVFGMIFSTIETIGHVWLYNPYWNPRQLEFLGNAMFDSYVLLTWTALYFGINYYLMMQREREKALQATAMAHQAQLQMLRYQLNPHFLFNTLNALSTLVLEKKTKLANTMLRHLSSFLRYTLVNPPSEMVTVESELEALKLYLDIEKVRFGDRLRVDWKIADEAKGALVPSLILQPLIENAVKYAIAPAEDGGTITVEARKKDDKLVISLTDTGPGIRESQIPDPAVSSGVGIVNTRSRLKQVYDKDQELKFDNLEPDGLRVTLVIPYETEQSP